MSLFTLATTPPILDSTMHNLSDLKEQLTNRGLEILGFEGWWLQTKIGRFTLACDQLYCDGDPIDKAKLNRAVDLVAKRVLTPKEVKESVYGKPQAWEVEESTSRLPDVQATQGKRSKAGSARKSRS